MRQFVEIIQQAAVFFLGGVGGVASDTTGHSFVLKIGNVTYSTMYYKSRFAFLQMDIKVKVGLRIKEIRIQKNLTQEAVAWEGEVDRTYMNHVENGRRNISIESLEKITKGLGVSFKNFFEGEYFDNPTNKK
jgi:DNA-binding XRE family transcriptional regulator